MKTYNIGDKVWYAERQSKIEQVTCPECFGMKEDNQRDVRPAMSKEAGLTE